MSLPSSREKASKNPNVLKDEAAALKQIGKILEKTIYLLSLVDQDKEQPVICHQLVKSRLPRVVELLILWRRSVTNPPRFMQDRTIP